MTERELTADICGARRQGPDGPEMCTIPPHGSWANHQFELVTSYYRRALADDRRRQEAAGVLPPRPPSGPVGGRHDDPRWRRTHDLDPDSWRSPDDGDRATTPDAGTPVPKDVAGYPAGAGEGRTMANAEEMAAAVGGVIAHIRTWQQELAGVKGNIESSVASAQGLLGRQNVDAVMQALNALAGAIEDTETALAKGEAAIEHLAAWSTTFGGMNN